MAVFVLALTIPANAVVLCAKQRSDGTFNTSVKIREVCKTREVELDPAGLGLEGEQGPAGPQGDAGVQGDPGSDGQDGAAGGFRVYDGDGVELGLVMDHEHDGYSRNIYTVMLSNGLVTHLDVRSERNQPSTCSSDGARVTELVDGLGWPRSVRSDLRCLTIPMLRA